MTKKKILVTGIILLAVIVGAGAYFIGRIAKKTLALEDFQMGGEYQYLQLAWGTSVADAKKTLKTSLETDPGKSPAPDHYEFYKTKKQYVLDGQTTRASLEFQGGRLQALQFAFAMDENGAEWFEKQIGHLQELLGSESERFENEDERFQSRGYKWDTEETTLQVVLIYGTKANVIFSLGSK